MIYTKLIQRCKGYVCQRCLFNMSAADKRLITSCKVKINVFTYNNVSPWERKSPICFWSPHSYLSGRLSTLAPSARCVATKYWYEIFMISNAFALNNFITMILFYYGFTTYIIFTTLKLCLANAIHNFKWVKITISFGWFCMDHQYYCVLFSFQVIWAPVRSLWVTTIV